MRIYNPKLKETYYGLGEAKDAFCRDQMENGGCMDCPLCIVAGGLCDYYVMDHPAEAVEKMGFLWTGFADLSIKKHTGQRTGSDRADVIFFLAENMDETEFRDFCRRISMLYRAEIIRDKTARIADELEKECFLN